MASRRLEVIIAGDAKGAKEAFDDTEKSADSLGSRMTSSLGNAGKAIGVAAVAGAVGIGIALKGAYDAAVESQKIANETERVIRTTGGAAGVSAEQVGSLAESLSEITGIDDEVIQSTENLMLTFTGVKNRVGEGNDVFTQATALSLDMATALGTDASGAAIQLGKALNDPIKGITALSRSGVSFTEQQKDQIKAMVESGNTLGAQKIILKELATEFGGAAEAAATPWEKLQVKIGNFQEAIGTRLIPIVDSAVGWIGDKLPGAFDTLDQVFANIIVGVEVFGEAWERADGQVTLSGFPGFMEDLAGKVKPVFDSIRAFVDDKVMPILADGFNLVKDDGDVAAAVITGVIATAFIALSIAAGQAAVSVAAATWPFVLIAVVIGGLAFAVIKLWQNWDTFREVVTGALSWLQTNGPQVFETVKNAVVDFYNVALVPLLGYISDNREQLANVGKVLLVVAAIVVGVVVAGWLLLAGAFVAAVVAVGLIVTGIVALVAVLYNLGQVFWDVFQNVKDAIATAWNAVFEFVTGIPERLGAAVDVIEAFFVALPSRIGAALAALPGILLLALVTVFDWATTQVGVSIGRLVSDCFAIPGLVMSTAGALWGVIQAIWGFVANEISNSVQRARNDVVFVFTQLPGMAAGALASLWSSISGAFYTARDQSTADAERLVRGVLGNLGSLPGRAASALSGFAGAVAGALGSAIGSARSIGENIMRGVGDGIQSMIGWATAAAKRAAENVVNGFKSALHIGSPSKVMADEVGRWIPAGVAMGIEQNLAILQSAVSTMMGVVSPGGYGIEAAAAELLGAMRSGKFIEEDLSFRGMSAQFAAFLDAAGETANGSSVNRNLLGGTFGSADSTWRNGWWDSGLLSGRLEGLSRPPASAGGQTVHINVNIEQGYVGDEDGLGRVITRHLSAAERSGVRMPWASVSA